MVPAVKWSYRIVTIGGTEVRIHATFFLLLGYFAWVFYQPKDPIASVYGVGFVLLIFFCVLLHEFGHATAARVFGIRTPSITLLPIGGVARLARMPTSPWQELVITLAGPAVNVAIAVGLIMFPDVRSGDGLPTALLKLNLMLAAFNMLPAFPMDGGRVLRALLATQMPYVTATKIAVRVGQGMAVVFAGMAFVPTQWTGPMLLLIAPFIFRGAQQELTYVQNRDLLQNTLVQDIMQTAFQTLPVDLRAGHAADFLIGSAQDVFPLADEQMNFKGIISREDLARAARELPAEAPINTRAQVPPTLEPGMSCQEALEIMQRLSEFALPVVNAAGQIVGLAVQERPAK